MKNTMISAPAMLVKLASLANGQVKTLDDFTTPAPEYTASLTNAQAPPVSSYEPLPPGSPLGRARYTFFSLGPNPDGQTSTVTIGNGVCVLSTGFDGATGLQLIYGYTSKGIPVPLG